MARRFTQMNVSPKEANEILEDILKQIVPDPVSVWEFGSPYIIFAATTTGRMFMIEATDDGAFAVSELDPTRFAIHEEQNRD